MRIAVASACLLRTGRCAGQLNRANAGRKATELVRPFEGSTTIALVLRRAAGRVRCIEAFGVPLELHVGERALARAIEGVLPPAWSSCDGQDVKARFSIRRSGNGYDVAQDDALIARDAAPAVAVQVLDSQMRLVIATHAPKHVFVHAGTVAVGDRAIVMPGRSFAGKTTLVAELIRRGATYLSDEYAVLDEDGLVHPYAKPLSVRAAGDTTRTASTETAAAALGATTAARAIAIGLIVATSYQPGARWSPEARSPADGALLLLANAFAARDDTERVLQVVGRAARDAVVLQGDRGDAGELAGALLELMRANGSGC